MCIIGIKPLHVADFTEKTLKYCWDKNDDGAGFAYWDGTKKLWVVKKGFMVFDEFMNEYAKYKFNGDNVSIVHFRIGTSGLNDAGNTHPFPICDDLDKMRVIEFESDAIAFHNGTVGKGDAIHSDTEVHIADFLFPIMPLWDDKRINVGIADAVLTKTNSRWVVCVGDKYYKYGTWHKHEGLEFSNYNYEPFTTTYVVGGNGTTYWNGNNDKTNGIWTKDKTGKDTVFFKDAQKMGLPKGIWTHGKCEGEFGFWSMGSFTSWKEYIAKVRESDNKIIQLPPPASAYDKVVLATSEVEFREMFITLSTTKKGKTSCSPDWCKFAKMLFVLRAREKNADSVAPNEKEKEDHTKDANKVEAIISDDGDFLFCSADDEKDMNSDLDEFRMCPACFENTFLAPSPFSIGNTICNNCGCVFTLETGEISTFDHDINKKYMERKA